MVAFKEPFSPTFNDIVFLSNVTPVTATLALVTVIWHVEVWPPSSDLAVMVALPSLSAFTVPSELTVATEVLLLLQLTFRFVAL